MELYFINLSRRPDRRAAMETQARRLGLALTRLDAMDAREAGPEELDRWFEKNGPLGEIPKATNVVSSPTASPGRDWWKAATPMRRCWRTMWMLSPRAPLVLQNADWIPPGTDLIKLEHYGPASQSVLLSDFKDVGHGFRLGRMRSRHTGAAAYILSRRAAELLLATPRFDLPVDHLLFNPNNSKLFARLRPWQLLPTVARQQDSWTPNPISKARGWGCGNSISLM